MATETLVAEPCRRPARYPASVQLTDDEEAMMAEMVRAGLRQSDVLRNGVRLFYRKWKPSQN